MYCGDADNWWLALYCICDLVIYTCQSLTHNMRVFRYKILAIVIVIAKFVTWGTSWRVRGGRLCVDYSGGGYIMTVVVWGGGGGGGGIKAY